jgi:hypothetical protein
MLGLAGDPVRRERRYLCSRKETLHAGPQPCTNWTVLAETIEGLVWRSVSELLRDPQFLIEQYQLQQEPSYGTPERQEQQRLERRLAALRREDQRPIDAYQAGVIELDEVIARAVEAGATGGAIKNYIAPWGRAGRVGSPTHLPSFKQNGDSPAKD